MDVCGDLHFQASLADSGLCAQIDQANPEDGLLWARMVLRSPAPMPLIGTLVTDPLAEALILEWTADNTCP